MGFYVNSDVWLVNQFWFGEPITKEWMNTRFFFISPQFSGNLFGRFFKGPKITKIGMNEENLADFGFNPPKFG